MSTNTALCRTAARCAPDGVTAVLCPGIADLPHFSPDDDRDPLPPAVAELRAAIAAADAVLFCTPEYAGTLPGSFKNLLDWTVGGTELTGKPVAWVRAASDPRRGEGAHATLATVLGYVQADVVEAACRHVPVGSGLVGTDGLIADPGVRAGIRETVAMLLGAR
jgi:NAD(P)H-dependent FMN reductase